MSNEQTPPAGDFGSTDGLGGSDDEHYFDDRDEPFDEPECERCHGDGMDPWTDYLLPCPLCQGEQAVPEQQGFEHSSSADCWCHPEAAHVDPDTGATVYVHKGVQ